MHLFADPTRISNDASVLIVGTGLSMADVVVSLARHGHEGRVTAISRRGIIPKSHDTGSSIEKCTPVLIHRHSTPHLSSL